MRGFIPTVVFIANRVQDEPHEETLRLHIEYRSSGKTTKIANRDIIDYLLDAGAITTKKIKKSQRERPKDNT